MTLDTVELPIEGMTCAACVRRVERALEGVAGVRTASVNFATGSARVAFDPASAGPAQLRAAVVRAGYQVGEAAASDGRARAEERRLHDLHTKWVVSLAIGLGVMLMMYVPIEGTGTLLAPAVLIAATIVQAWAGRGFTSRRGTLRGTEPRRWTRWWRSVRASPTGTAPS